MAARTEGPLGLGRWHHTGAAPEEVLVYPDLPAARRLALAVRRGRFREQGAGTRGPLGLGTDFESIRDYPPDDDVRQINWRATDRTGRPMSNQFRVEQDRDVMLLIDAGRLMAAPLGDRTRLDAAIDAAVAVALVADVLGDRAGVVAFDDDIRRSLPPRRAGGDAVVARALRPRAAPRRHRLRARLPDRRGRQAQPHRDLLRPARRGRRAAARRRRAGARPPPRGARRERPRPRPRRAARHHARHAARRLRPAVALDVLAARARVAHGLERAGASVLEAPAGALPAACVRAYLRAKARARL